MKIGMFSEKHAINPIYVINLTQAIVFFVDERVPSGLFYYGS